MKIDLMRKIDFWAGWPLTLLLSNLYRFVEWFRSPRPARMQPVRRILFIEMSEMGSTILADPAMRRARDLYPQAELFFLIFAGNRASLDILGTIAPAHIVTIRSDRLIHLLLDTLRVLYRLRRLRLDMVIDLELFSRYSSLLSLLSGAGWRVGFHNFHGEGLYRGRHLTHPVWYNAHQHIAKNFLALVHAPLESSEQLPHTKRVFQDEDMRLAPYQVSPAGQEALRARLLTHAPQLARYGRWIILNPNASELMPLRKWPLTHYAGLAERLLEDPDIALLITGVAAERADARFIQAQAGAERVIDLTGFTRLAELPLLYTLCDMLVTNDSGPAHFAAPTGIHTLVLFGPETPALYGALNPNASFVFKGLACSPCVSAANHRKSPCTDNQCMKQISVDEVYEKVLNGLRTSGTMKHIDPKRQIS